MGLARLFLALVVVIDHWYLMTPALQALPFDDRLKLGFNAGYAVMFFYVVSGFLITYALDRKYGSDVLAFYKGRFVRIFSFYWPVVVLAFILLPGAWAQFLAGSAADKLTGIFLLGMDWRVAFASYPEQHWGAAVKGIGPAWTLGAELAFYLMAPLLMRSWKIAAAILLISFAVRAYFATEPLGPWNYQFFPATICFFLLGHFACRWKPLVRPRFGIALLCCSLAVMTFGTRSGFDNWRLWISVLCFALALPGLFKATKDLRWMNVAGDLSYPVYLLHMLVIMLVGAELAAATGEYGSVAAILALVIVTAAVVHRVIELPVAQGMRWMLGSTRRWARAP